MVKCDIIVPFLLIDFDNHFRYQNLDLIRFGVVPYAIVIVYLLHQELNIE